VYFFSGDQRGNFDVHIAGHPIIAQETVVTMKSFGPALHLNSHYATISTDANYTALSVKATANNSSAAAYISNLRLLKALDTLWLTETGLDNIPARFLRIGASFFNAPLADLMNLSLSSSTVPQQWQLALTLPTPKISTPYASSDYRPISITSVLSRILECLVVSNYFYPLLSSPPPGLTFSDQFAF
jgi:hypothetical protein